MDDFERSPSSALPTPVTNNTPISLPAADLLEDNLHHVSLQTRRPRTTSVQCRGSVTKPSETEDGLGNRIRSDEFEKIHGIRHSQGGCVREFGQQKPLCLGLLNGICISIFLPYLSLFLPRLHVPPSLGYHKHSCMLSLCDLHTQSESELPTAVDSRPLHERRCSTLLEERGGHPNLLCVPCAQVTARLSNAAPSSLCSGCRLCCAPRKRRQSHTKQRWAAVAGPPTQLSTTGGPSGQIRQSESAPQAILAEWPPPSLAGKPREYP